MSSGNFCEYQQLLWRHVLIQEGVNVQPAEPLSPHNRWSTWAALPTWPYQIHRCIWTTRGKHGQRSWVGCLGECETHTSKHAHTLLSNSQKSHLQYYEWVSSFCICSDWLPDIPHSVWWRSEGSRCLHIWSQTEDVISNFRWESDVLG